MKLVGKLQIDKKSCQNTTFIGKILFSTEIIIGNYVFKLRSTSFLTVIELNKMSNMYTLF